MDAQEAQFDGLTEPERQRLLEKLALQTEADIRAFSMFLKLPTVVLLMANLVFAYGCVSRRHGATLPFTSYRVRAGHPIVATELSVVTLQLTLHLLSSGRWDRAAQRAVAVLAASGAGHALACNKGGAAELCWWLLPVANLAVVSYAQLNMRRSRRDVEALAARVRHGKAE
ncbi:hypothetical protein H4R18_004259 [Coemansia javaensis]|uniref:Uncharacterized protein n=1 Tax=Coemansia javaensis TaxID=2761396 RepID=A0A9W8H6N7_9FUNG|nr:hypothetical protein H4R18_004259 [Coemansia javaensis]